MPIQNRDDAVEVEGQIAAIFGSPPEGRTNAIRRLFVESLDFGALSGQVSLAGAPANAMLPAAAERVAALDGVQVLYIALDTANTDRVRRAEVDAAARLIGAQLTNELLLVFTNTSASQIHLIFPKFEGTRPTLRRMVVERHLPRRTAVQQVARHILEPPGQGHHSALLWMRPSTLSRLPRNSSASTSAYSRNMMGVVAGFGEGRETRRREFSCRRCSTG